MGLKTTGLLKKAIDYSTSTASEDVASMLVVGGTLGSSTSGGLPTTGGLSTTAGPPAGTLIPAGAVAGGAGVLGVATGGGGVVLLDTATDDKLKFDEVIRRLSIALENLTEEDLAEQLTAAKQINVLANQILAITFQSGLGDAKISQALVAEAQALKERSLAILRGVLDFINKNAEEEDDGDH